MNKILVVARREIADRSFVFIAAVFCALIPFTSALFRVASQDRGYAAVSVALGLGLAVLAGSAIGFGNSMIGRELSERRMSFYFSRPLTGTQIWFGKLLASLLTITAALYVVILPALLVYPAQWRELFGISPRGSFYAFGGAAMLLLVMHALSTMIRSRSPLLAIDFAAFVIFALVAALSFVPLLTHAAFALARTLLITVLVAIAATLILAGAWQLSRGRIDRLRNHIELSKFLWSCLGVVLVALAGFSLWVQSVQPADLTGRTFAARTSSSRWVYLEGAAKHRGDYQQAFLLDPASGAFLPLSAWFNSVPNSVNREGTAAVWMQPSSDLALLGSVLKNKLGNENVVTIGRLGAHPRAESTGIQINRWVDALAVSGDANRVAVFTSPILTVYDVAAHRALASVRIPLKGGGIAGAELSFLAPDTVSVVLRERRDRYWSVQLFDFDVRTRTLRPLMAQEAEAQYIRVAREGQRIYWRALRPQSGPAIRVFDTANGRELFTIDVPAGVRFYEWLLGDGRLVVAETSATRKATVRVYAPDGSLQRTFALADADTITVAGESAPGQLLVRVVDGGRKYASLVDVNAGAQRTIEPGLAPLVLHPYQRTLTGPPSALFSDEKNLIRRDPVTGAKTKLAGG